MGRVHLGNDGGKGDTGAKAPASLFERKLGSRQHGERTSSGSEKSDLTGRGEGGVSIFDSIPWIGRWPAGYKVVAYLEILKKRRGKGDFFGKRRNTRNPCPKRRKSKRGREEKESRAPHQSKKELFPITDKSENGKPGSQQGKDLEKATGFHGCHEVLKIGTGTRRRKPVFGSRGIK